MNKVALARIGENHNVSLKQIHSKVDFLRQQVVVCFTGAGTPMCGEACVEAETSLMVQFIVQQAPCLLRCSCDTSGSDQLCQPSMGAP